MKNALTTTQRQVQVKDFSDAFAAAIMQAQGQEVATSRELPSPFSNRTVALLDDAGMGDHNIYVNWARIDYGVWMDAEEVANAGGMREYLQALGMRHGDVKELMAQGYEIQAADGLAARCLRDRGEFEWGMLGELLDVLSRYRMAA